MNHRKEIENDIWLANQLDAIRQMKTDHEVDVTDSVMQRIAKLQPLATGSRAKRHLGYKIASSAIAACIAVVLTISLLPSGKPDYAPTNSNTLTNNFSEVYGFYMDGNNGGDAAILENPMASFI